MFRVRALRGVIALCPYELPGWGLASLDDEAPETMRIEKPFVLARSMRKY